MKFDALRNSDLGRALASLIQADIDLVQSVNTAKVNLAQNQ